MFGIGSTEMLGVAVTGGIWRVPRTLMMRWNGRLGAGVTAKDMMLRMIGRLGMNGGRYQAVEFCGEAVRALSMQERMTLSNMSAELGSQVGLVAPDATTEAWLREAGVRGPLDIAHWQSDPDADAEWHDFDAAALAPQVAALHSPANAADVSVHAGVAVQAAISAPAPAPSWTTCAPQPPCCAAPRGGGRQADGGARQPARPERCRARGRAADAAGGGAQLLPTSCGACAGYGGSIPDGATVISTTARNFKGRMGSETAQVYLASPYSVKPRRPRAASSIPGGAAMNQHGRVWRVGADIDTDALAPAPT